MIQEDFLVFEDLVNEDTQHYHQRFSRNFALFKDHGKIILGLRSLYDGKIRWVNTRINAKSFVLIDDIVYKIIIDGDLKILEPI